MDDPSEFYPEAPSPQRRRSGRCLVASAVVADDGIRHLEQSTGEAAAHRRIVTKENGTRHHRARPLDEQIALPAGTVPAIVPPVQVVAPVTVK